MPPPVERPHYPAVAFLRRHGDLLAILVGAAVAMVGLVLTVSGAGWGWLLAGLAVGALAWLLMKAFCELVQIIATTLLPE